MSISIVVVPAFSSARYQQIVEGYRPSFMKWDHTYGGLEEGVRFDSTMTFMQAHNKTIRAIRNALPDDLKPKGSAKLPILLLNLGSNNIWISISGPIIMLFFLII